VYHRKKTTVTSNLTKQLTTLTSDYIYRLLPYFLSLQEERRDIFCSAFQSDVKTISDVFSDRSGVDFTNVLRAAFRNWVEIHKTSYEK